MKQPLTRKKDLGRTVSTAFSPQEIEKLKSEFKLTEDELRKLYRRFKKLEGGKGTIGLTDFQQISELSVNPLLERVLQVFDADEDGQIFIEDFLAGLSVFMQKGNEEAKLRFAFAVYDIDRDGYISNGELYHVLKMMVGNNLNEEQLQQIVDKTIIYADKDGDGKVSFEEFVKMLENVEDVVPKLTMNLGS